MGQYPIINQWWLAWRFFAGSSTGSLVKFISRISMFGLTLAIALLFLVLSVMNGFEKEFRDRILDLAPHANLWYDSPVVASTSLIEQLNASPFIKKAQYVVEFKALAAANNRTQPLLIKGLEEQAVNDMFAKFLHHDKGSTSAINVNTFSFNPKQKEILMGSSLAHKLSLSTGQSVRLMLLHQSAGQQSQTLDAVKSESFRVRNIFTTGTEVDQHLAVIDIQQSATVLEHAGLVQGIELQFYDLFNARSLAYQTAVNFNLAVRVSDWTQSFGNLYAAIKLSRELVVLLIGSIIAVACFNVFVTLAMVVKQKTKAIAILRTMGLMQHQVLGIFMLHGLIITFFACFMGGLLGFLLTTNIAIIVPFIEFFLDFELLNTEIYPINYLPADIKINDFLLICTVTTLMTLLATIVPAIKASRIQPARALRYF
jgi:lipoprotein-releasing system permease protein